MIQKPYHVWVSYCSHDSYVGNGVKLSQMKSSDTNSSPWKTLNNEFLNFVLRINQLQREEQVLINNFTFAGKNTIFTSVFYSLLTRTNISNAQNIFVAGHSEGRSVVISTFQVNLFNKNLKIATSHNFLQQRSSNFCPQQIYLSCRNGKKSAFGKKL